MTRNSVDLLNEIEDRVRQHPILSHAFLMRLSAGELTKEQVAIWVGQQFFFSSQFPRCLAAVYARVQDFEVSKPLINFLAIEHWGSAVPGAHWQQFRTVLNAFGYDIDNLKKRKPFEETGEYLDFRLRLCLERSPEEALGAMGFGHELVNESIFAAYLAGVEKVPGIPEDALEYFRSHVDDEPEDFAIFKRMMTPYADSEESLHLIQKGAEDVLAARYRFFDRILDRLEAAE